MPNMFNEFEVWTVGNFHSLYFQILEVSLISTALWGRGLSSWRTEFSPRLEIWDCHWLENLMSISRSIEMASNGSKPCFSNEGRYFCTYHTVSTKRCYHIGSTLSFWLGREPICPANLDCKSSLKICFVTCLWYPQLHGTWPLIWKWY